jgi:hypothetical protein
MAIRRHSDFVRRKAASRLALLTVFVLLHVVFCSLLQAETGEQSAESKATVLSKTTTTNGVAVYRDVVVDRNGDGVGDLFYGFIRRGAEMVSSYSIDNLQEQASRLFYHNGHRILGEWDSDGDGFYEVMLFFSSDSPKPIEIVFKDKDGKVHIDDAKASTLLGWYKKFYAP